MGLFSGIGAFISDQKSRISNVVAVEATVLQNVASTLTLGAIKSSSTIVATPGSGVVGQIGQAIAQNPLTSAGILAAGASAPVRGAISSTISGLSTGTKIAGIAAVPIAAGIVAANPGGTISAAIGTPSALINVGKNVGTFAAHPTLQNAENIVKQNPIISGAIAAVGITTIGLGTSSIISNALNTSAVKKNTEATLQGSSGSASSQSPASAPTVINNYLPASPAVAPLASTSSIPQPVTTGSPQATPKKKTAKKKKKKAKKKPARKKAKKRSVKKKKSKKRSR